MRYLGIDVSKARLDCALFDPLADRRKTKVVANPAGGFKRLAAWLDQQGAALSEVHGVLEATGVYHEQAAWWLADAGVTIPVANPAQAKDFARGLAVRTKTDRVDSIVLAVLRSRTFRSAERVAAFLGWAPVEHPSGGSIQKRPRLSRNGDAKTRVVWYMAVVGTRYDPEVKALCQRLLTRGKAKMAALGAAMRKLVHWRLGVLKHQQNYRQFAVTPS